MTAKSFITRISFKFSGCNSFGCLSVDIILPFFFCLIVLQYLVVSNRKIFFYNSDADHKSSSTPSIILEIR